MPLRERDAGTSFQIALEGDNTSFIRKLDHNVNRTRAILCRVNAAACVVLHRIDMTAKGSKHSAVRDRVSFAGCDAETDNVRCHKGPRCRMPQGPPSRGLPLVRLA